MRQEIDIGYYRLDAQSVADKGQVDRIVNQFTTALDAAISPIKAVQVAPETSKDKMDSSHSKKG
jgi:hypothetical protein